MSRATRSLLLAASFHLILLVGSADGQPCGIGRLTLNVIDSEGQSVDNLTVELLKPESREPFFKGRWNGMEDRQTGRGAQSAFSFPTPPGGGTGAEVTIRYTAPGYFTYEETGAYLMGCDTSHVAILMRSFDTTPDAAGLPSLVGVVREFFFENAEADVRNQAPGRPLPGVTVIAEKDGKQLRAVTDARGRYKFDGLPSGDYVVRPLLPRTLEPYDTNGFALNGISTWVWVNTGIRRYSPLNESPQKHAQGLQGAGLAASIGNGEIAARVDFFALPSGRIGGRVEGVYEKDHGVNYSGYLKLRRVNPQTKEVERVVTRGAYSNPMSSGPEKAKDFSFTFYQVPAGKYVIELEMKASFDSAKLQFFYPGVDSVERAEVIDFPEGGALTALTFKLPPLITRRVYGQVTMPDGKVVDARLRIVDAAQPSASSEAAGPIGTISFYFFRGRRFHLYAYFDGERDGKPVRYSGQALNQWDGPVKPDAYEGDFGPINIVLKLVERR